MHLDKLDETAAGRRRSRALQMLAVFLVALIIRGCLFVSVRGEPGVFLQPDSRMYLLLSEGLSKYGSLVYPNRPAHPDAERLPGYPFFISVVQGAFGGGLQAVVAIQILLDSLSCVLVCLFADRVIRGTAVIAGVLACLNIGMIAYAHFVLNDSLFVFVFLLFLLALFKVLQGGEWRWAAVLGIAAGVGVLIRPVVMYLPIFLSPFLLAFLLRRRHGSWVGAAGRTGLMVAMFILCLSPWMLRNYSHYGRLKLSAQSGEHLLQYIVPFVWQYSKGIPFIEGMKKMSDEFQEKAAQAGLDLQKATPFEVSDFQVNMGMHYLRGEPKVAILKAWMYGAAKNLFAPAIVDFSYLLRIERPHFFYTQGTTTLERAWNFLKGMKGWFGWAVMGSLLVLILSRIIQIWAVVQVMRSKPWEGLFLLLIVGYFLLVSGPVGYAKYRLPFEPILMIFLAVGVRDLYERWIRKDGGVRMEGKA
jgi:4-amino-4-deoxy-L-arabinose transferase-like glycosyltransferase